MQRSFWLPVAAAAILLTLAPTPASADTYSVFSCRDPLGQPNAAVGWTGAQSGSGIAVNACPSGGALTAWLPDANPAGNTSATWRFAAPAGTLIVRAAAHRTTLGLKKSTQTFDMAYAMETNFGLPDTATLESCVPSTGSSCIADLTEPVEKQGLSGATLTFRALCTNSGGTCTGPLRVDASQVDIGLQDPAAPTVADARVLDDGDRSGRLSVRFNAADVGGGLYRTVIKVDGKPMQTLPLAAAPCADLLPTDGDPYQFDVPQPCPPLLTNARATVDIKTLTPGPHGVEIAVEDAAGNETAVHGPTEFPRPNVVTGSSVPAAAALRARLRMWFVKAPFGDRRRYTSRYGTRVVTRGRLLTPSGKGIQGARIDVYHIRNGKRKLLKTGLKTREKGRLTLILPLDVDTRTIEYAYRALRPGPITSRQRLSLTVLTRNGQVYHRKSSSKR